MLLTDEFFISAAEVDSLSQASLALLLKIKKTSGFLKWFKRGVGDRFIPQKKTIRIYLSAAAESVWKIWSITEEEVESEAGRRSPAQKHKQQSMFVCSPSFHTVHTERGKERGV